VHRCENGDAGFVATCIPEKDLPRRALQMIVRAPRQAIVRIFPIATDAEHA